jgi:two-component system response regulator YesN
MEDISLEFIAQKFYFNPSYFSNLFKSYTGACFSEYLLGVRIQNARRLLRQSECSMSEIAARLGFKDPTYFNRMFKREVGVSPNKYRQMSGDDWGTKL